MINLFLFIIIFHLLSSEPHFTQSETDNLKVKRFSFRDGLLENEVNYILQDFKGFLWVFTPSGLNRFDGRAFYQFTAERFEGGINVIMNSGFAVSDDIILFISQNAELWSYNYKSGMFNNLSKTYDLSRFKFTSGLLTKNNKIFITATYGLLETNINFTTQHFHPFLIDSSSNQISFAPSFIKEDGIGNLWMNYFETGLIMFDTRTNKFSNPLNEALNKKRINNISFVQNGEYIISVSEVGAFIKIKLENFSIEKLSDTKLTKEKTISVYYSEAYSDSQIFIGTNNGLYLLNYFNFKYQKFVNDPDDKSSLSANRINLIFSDNVNTFWFATPNGLDRFSIVHKNFFKEDLANNFKKVIADNEILYTLNEKKLTWYLTTNGFVVRNKTSGKFFHYLDEKNSKTGYAYILRYILKDSDNNYWVSSWGNGIIRFRIDANFNPGDNIKFDNFVFDINDSSSLGGLHAAQLLEDKKGNIWISLWNSGLNVVYSFEKKLNKPKFYRYRKSNFPDMPSDYAAAMMLDNWNNIWISFSSGLCRFNPNNSTFERIIIDKTDSTNNINLPPFFAKDIDDDLILGSFSGISEVKFLNDGNYQIQKLNIPIKYRLMQIEVDRKGKIWFGTNQAVLYSYDPKSGNLLSYDIENEISGFFFDYSFTSKDSEGNIYFKSMRFNPEKLIINSVPPKVFLNSVYINNNEKYFGCDASDINEIVLNYYENNVLLKFSVLNYIKSELNGFKYRVAGKDSMYINIDQPEILLASLHPGVYRIEFKGSNNNGVWSEQTAVLTIKVLSPFWATWWFRSLIGFTLMSFIIFYFLMRIRRLNNEKLIHQRYTHQLITTQEDERIKVAKEIHDSVGQNLIVLKNLISIYKNEHSADNEDLRKISEIIGETIDEVRSISSELHPHQLYRLGFKIAVEAMMRKIIYSSGISISYYIDEQLTNLSSPYNINVYRIIQEAFNNIIKHSKARSASLSMKVIGKNITLEIIDDGIGVDEVNENSGFGLVSMRERALLLNGELTITSSSKGTILKLSFEEKHNE